MSEISDLKIWVVGDRIITPGDQRGLVTSANKKIGITWENGLSGEYTPKQIQAYGYQKSSEEKEAMSTTTPKENASCNLNTPASLQESEVLNSELMPPEPPTSSKLKSSSKITATRNSSSATDFLVSPSTATSKTITLSQENLTSTQLDFLAPVLALQETEPDLTTQNQNSGLKPCAALPTAAPASSSLKILQDLSTEDYEQFLGDCEWLAISGMIRKSYQLRNLDRPKKEKGFLSLPTPTTYAKGSTGCRPAGQTRLEQKLRPYITKGDKLNPAVPGWMMGFPVGWVEWPLMDAGETISVQLPFTQEYAAILTSAGNVTTCTPVPSVPSKLRSQLNESAISQNSPLTRVNAQPGTYIINQFKSLGIIKENLGFGFVVDWSNSGQITYNWERDDQLIAELALAQPAAPTFRYLSGGCGMCGLEPVNFLEEKTLSANIERTQQLHSLQIGDRVRILKTRTQNLSQWVGKEGQVTGINAEIISVAAGEGREKKHFTLKKGWYELIPVSEAGARTRATNFLEEKQEAAQLPQQPKPSKQKGCLYKYLENKKLKDGTIANYPRVVGHRKPDNPTHWRWGYNWEEKIDREWKGRSIGSVPVGAVPMIQSMQREGASLEEIIGFIKRAKAKKS